MNKGDVSGKEMMNVSTKYEHVITTPKFKRRKVPAAQDFPPGCRRRATADLGLNKQIAVDQGMIGPSGPYGTVEMHARVFMDFSLVLISQILHKT
ncbi:hypothetical protein J1N35_004028 [Gossypium stocksii]|uniref:Uncharacterized protein n=1 Tax=Gossypium stocksii TaxID=47602 RepID=A0A9D3WBX7_9ROSI|nr:hypothetical protein J1N35_004028 [Gossypium stocksii]